MTINMIVCSCNAIRECDVRKAARRGAPCVDSAYRSLGCESQCGTCLCYDDEVIAEERAKLLTVAAKAA